LEQDAQLIQQCLQGDGSAWEELVRRHSRRIFNICYRFTGNRTEVLEVPEGTVKSRINRGRIELARILQQMGVRPA